MNSRKPWRDWSRFVNTGEVFIFSPQLLKLSILVHTGYCGIILIPGGPMFMDNQNFIGMGRHNLVDSLFFSLYFSSQFMAL